MSFSYSLDRLYLARNRVRRDLRDTTEAGARYQDEELDTWLAESANRSLLWVRFDSATPGVTGATVQVAQAADGLDLTLVLQRTTAPAEPAASYALSAEAHRTLSLLLAAVRAAAGGWQVGLGTGVSVNWVLPPPDDTPTREALDAALALRSVDMEPMAAAVSVFGVTRALAVLCPDRVVVGAQRRFRAGVGFSRYREKDVEWTLAPEAEASVGRSGVAGVKVPAVPL